MAPDKHEIIRRHLKAIITRSTKAATVNRYWHDRIRAEERAKTAKKLLDLFYPGGKK